VPAVADCAPFAVPSLTVPAVAECALFAVPSLTVPAGFALNSVRFVDCQSVVKLQSAAVRGLGDPSL